MTDVIMWVPQGNQILGKEPTVWAAFIPKEDECCPFTLPGIGRVEAVYQKDWKCGKTTYDQEEMNDENRY